ncbi:MAG: DsbA family protein [Tistlia sp.]|uniref:DsbA family protein n=1 Tax=Tistlia sp. TaxID=3057121 RepID=UPI0034A4A7F1
MTTRLLPAGLAAALFGAVIAFSSPATAQGALEAAEKAEIEAVIHDYLMDNPEVILEAIQGFQQRQKDQAEAQRQQAVRDSLAALREDPADPVLGNPQGDVVVVEFFDYQCGYCKRVAEGLQQAVADDGGIKLVMKEFPILGPASILAAKAALAAERQDLYEPFHWALMQNKGSLDEAAIDAVAAEVGLDLERLKADMADPKIDERLAENYALAERLDINGTPAFVIGEELVPGALPMEQFRHLVERARQG